MRNPGDLGARIGLIVLIPILAAVSLLSSCRPETATDRTEWLRETAALHFDMNMQLLSMDSSFDAADRDPEAVQKCDPSNFRSTFNAISVRLTRLTKMPAFRNKEEIERNFERIQEAWAHIKTLQESLWIETVAIPELPAKDRCLRTSSMLAKRIAIEKGFKAIFSDAL